MVDVFWRSKFVVGIFSLIFFDMFHRIRAPHNALNYIFPCPRSGKCTPLYMNIVSESDSKLVYSKLSIAVLYLGWYSHVPFLWDGNFTGDCQPVFAAFLVCWGTVQEMKHLEDYENVNLWYNYDTMKNGINLPHTAILYLDPAVLEQLNSMPRAMQIIWNKIYMIICGNCLPQLW